MVELLTHKPSHREVLSRLPDCHDLLHTVAVARPVQVNGAKRGLEEDVSDVRTRARECESAFVRVSARARVYRQKYKFACVCLCVRVQLRVSVYSENVCEDGIRRSIVKVCRYISVHTNQHAGVCA